MRICLALQGGGSFTAFTTGVLNNMKHIKFDSVSGTSGGAIQAALFVQNQQLYTETSYEFWKSLAGRSFPALMYFQQFIPEPLKMVDYSSALQTEIEKFVQFEEIRKSHVNLYIGATNLRTNEFVVWTNKNIDSKKLLSSCVIIPACNPVEIDGQFFVDGLWSQNPPISPFVQRQIPDEIWIVRIDATNLDDGDDTTSIPLTERKKQLFGNISLENELQWLRMMMKHFPHHVTIREITLPASEVGQFKKTNLTGQMFKRLVELGSDISSDFLKNR